MFHTRKRRWQTLVLLLGILLPQLFLLGPSLFGDKVLLPVDLVPRYSPSLVSPGAPTPTGPPRWPDHYDTLLQYEPFRRFAIDELRAGLLPTWNPYNYGGSPFIGNGQSAIFSPYRLIEFASPDPRVLAWSQLCKALVAGVGMFVFLRFGLRLSFRGAALGAWVYPLSGYLTVWIGSPMAAGATWMPWALWATKKTLRERGWRGPAWLALFTAFGFFAGHVQIIGHTLLLSGGYAVFRLARRWPMDRAAVLRCACGWAVGLMLAAPQVFPFVEYVRESRRLEVRRSGVVERPSLEPFAAVQTLQPWTLGDRTPGSHLLTPSPRQETAAAAYAGLILTLAAAPLAWRARRRRGVAFFWAGVAVFGLGQVLGIPGLAWLAEHPPLSMLSGNRMTCLTAFALCVLGAIGADAAGRRMASTRFTRSLVLMVVAVLAIAVLWRMARLEVILAAAMTGDSASVPAVRPWFVRELVVTLGLLAAVAGFIVMLTRDRCSRPTRRRIVAALTLACVAEAAWMAMPAVTQADGAWYPRDNETTRALRALPAGRFITVGTIESNMNLFADIPCVTGYDALDPARVATLILSTDPQSNAAASYSALMYYRPNFRGAVLDAMATRYVVYPRPVPALGTPALTGPSLYVYENPTAAPRVTVPSRAAMASDADQLRMLNGPEFKAGQIALTPLGSGVAFEGASGVASIVAETPSRARIGYDMKTPGLVVLADTWFPGWRATVDGRDAAIVRVNTCQRGVAVPAGRGEVVFSYEPSSLRAGWWIGGAGLVSLMAMSLASIGGRPRK